MNRAPLLVLLAVGSLLATGGCSSPSDTTTAGDAGSPTDGAVAADAGTAGPDAATVDAGRADAAATGADAGDPASAFEYSDGGCITYGGASKLCGFSSDGKICKASEACAHPTNPNEGQCKINCEMGTTVKCNTRANVSCLLDAVKAGSCSAITACGWIL